MSMATAPVTGPRVRPISTDPPVGYLANVSKYRRVDDSILVGFLLLFGSHIPTDATFWMLTIGVHTWRHVTDTAATVTLAAWPMGALIGCFFYNYVLIHVPKKVVDNISILFLFISGLCFVAGGTSMFACNVGRTLAGVCGGITYISTLKQIGDNIPRTYRGAIATKVSMVIALSSLVGSLAVYARNAVYGVDENGNIGYGTLTASLVAATVSYFPTYNYESVVQLVSSGKDREAIDLLVKLHNESDDSSEIQNEFDEVKSMVDEANAEAKLQPNHIFSSGNQKVLGMVFELKVLNVMTSCYAFRFYSAVFNGTMAHNVIESIMFPALRIIALYVPLALVDTNGRQNLLLVSVIGTFTSLVALLIEKLFLRGALAEIAIDCTAGVMVIFASIGLNGMQHVYTVEAFPLAKRTASIMFITCSQHVMQIVLSHLFVITSQVNGLGFFFGLTIPFYAIGLFVGGLWLWHHSPETRGLTLRRCHSTFNPGRRPDFNNPTTGGHCGP